MKFQPMQRTNTEKNQSAKQLGRKFDALKVEMETQERFYQKYLKDESQRIASEMLITADELARALQSLDKGDIETVREALINQEQYHRSLSARIEKSQNYLAVMELTDIFIEEQEAREAQAQKAPETEGSAIR